MLKRVCRTCLTFATSSRTFQSNELRIFASRYSLAKSIIKEPNNRLSLKSQQRRTFSFFTKMPLESAKSLEDEEDLNKQRQVFLDSLDDNLDTLKDLSEAYSIARQESSSKWLDFSKSCYIYLYLGGGEPSSAMAAFDLDGTIIKPKSNKRIPKSATDWQLFSVWIKMKLQLALAENQARFVIFTNQNGVGLGIVALEEVQERIELVTKRLNVPCTVFVAIDKDEFRKPRVGMFKLFEKAFNGSVPIEREKSFYCGDAIGYPSHSDADIEFARTLGLPFLPPDKFVRGVKPKLLEHEKASR